MTGCEIIKCPDFKDGQCTSEADYVNRQTGEAMCPRNVNAVPREEYEETWTSSDED
jgi:hypothetical protein